MASHCVPPPVTEFSRLRIKQGLHEAQEAVIERVLARAKQLMEEFTGRQFFIFEELEKSEHIYIVGEWASVEQHMNEWVPSPQNQKLLKDLSSFAEVDFLFHLEVPLSLLPVSQQIMGAGIALSTQRLEGAPRMPIFSCGRHIMDDVKRPGFDRTFTKRKHCLEAHSMGYVGGGWRIEKEHGREELVLFCPWKDIYQHHAFAETAEYQEYSEIKDFVDAFEVCHLAIKELPPAPSQSAVPSGSA